MGRYIDRWVDGSLDGKTDRQCGLKGDIYGSRRFDTTLTLSDILTYYCTLLDTSLRPETSPSILENGASLTAMYPDCADIFQHPLD